MTYSIHIICSKPITMVLPNNNFLNVTYLNFAVSGSNSKSSLIGEFGTFLLNCSKT